MMIRSQPLASSSRKLAAVCGKRDECRDTPSACLPETEQNVNRTERGCCGLQQPSPPSSQSCLSPLAIATTPKP